MLDQRGAPTVNTTAPIVHSCTEWDPLEEVVVGRMAGGVFPMWQESMRPTMPEDSWPGYVRTPMQEGEHSPQAIRDCESTLPAGRLGRPAEIAALGAYLASAEAAFITGRSLIIDGARPLEDWPAHERRRTGFERGDARCCCRSA